jgi:hypothetical protein
MVHVNRRDAAILKACRNRKEDSLNAELGEKRGDVLRVLFEAIIKSE